MEISAIVSLLTTFGPSAITLIEGLIKKAETGGTMSSAEWETLTASLQVKGKDLMLSTLQKLNIDPASAQGVALLAAAS